MCFLLALIPQSSPSAQKKKEQPRVKSKYTAPAVFSTKAIFSGEGADAAAEAAPASSQAADCEQAVGAEAESAASVST